MDWLKEVVACTTFVCVGGGEDLEPTVSAIFSIQHIDVVIVTMMCGGSLEVIIPPV
jgi:hypothetical protein